MPASEPAIVVQVLDWATDVARPWNQWQAQEVPQPAAGASPPVLPDEPPASEVEGLLAAEAVARAIALVEARL